MLCYFVLSQMSSSPHCALPPGVSVASAPVPDRAGVGGGWAGPGWLTVCLWVLHLGLGPGLFQPGRGSEVTVYPQIGSRPLWQMQRQQESVGINSQARGTV